MDLDTYAFSHNDAAAEQGNSSSAEGKGKQPVRDVDEQPASLEGDVRQLAQNVSSWWSGFAQKVSTHASAGWTSLLPIS